MGIFTRDVTRTKYTYLGNVFQQNMKGILILRTISNIKDVER